MAYLKEIISLSGPTTSAFIRDLKDATEPRAALADLQSSPSLIGSRRAPGLNGGALAQPVSNPIKRTASEKKLIG
jgi:hypothetical protein